MSIPSSSPIVYAFYYWEWGYAYPIVPGMLLSGSILKEWAGSIQLCLPIFMRIYAP